MAITLVNSATAVLAAGAGSTAVSLPASMAENDVVVINLACDFLITQASSQGVDSGQGWTLEYEDTQAFPGAQVATKRMGATPDTTVNITPRSDRKMVVTMQAWRGVNTTTALDATSTFAYYDPAAITTVTDGAKVISCGAWDNTEQAPGLGVPTGYGNLVEADTVDAGSEGATAAMASKTVTTAGAEDPGVWTFSGSPGNHYLTVALRPAASGIPRKSSHYRKMMGA